MVRSVRRYAKNMHGERCERETEKEGSREDKWSKQRGKKRLRGREKATTMYMRDARKRSEKEMATGRYLCRVVRRSNVKVSG